MIHHTFDWTLQPLEIEEWIIILDKGSTRYWFAGYGTEGERRWVKYQADAMTFGGKEAAIDMYDELDIPELILATAPHAVSY